MFGQNANTSPTKNNPPSFANPNNSQNNNIDIENLPIHTMAEDLERIKNPNAFKNKLESEKKASPIDRNKLSQKQQSSPFLNETNTWNDRSILNEKIQDPILPNRELPKSTIQTTPQTPNKDPFSTSIDEKITPKQPVLEKNPIPENNPANPIEIVNESPSEFNWKLLLSIISSIILLVALIWTGYSYLKNKKTIPTTIEETPTPIATETPISTPTPEVTQTPEVTPNLSYSQENPNYFILGPEINDAEKIKSALKQRVQKVAQEGYENPVEFIITDEKNTPLTFKSFSNRIGLTFSNQVLDNLADNFSLFIYNDNLVSRIGLVIDSKNDTTLSAAMLQEEKNLADGINQLFFTTDYKKDKLFNSSEYGGAKIRYQNIISPENLSVDYTVFKNKLIIGTTKLTIRAIIDHLDESAATGMGFPQ